MNMLFGLSVLGTVVAVTLLSWASIEIATAAVHAHREAFTRRAQLTLRELFVFVDPRKFYVMHMAIVLGTFIVLWLGSGNPLFALAVAASVLFAPRLVLRWIRRRRLEKIEAQLPDALLSLAGALKAGLSLTNAMSHLVREQRPPLSQELDLVLREQRLGVPLDDALANLARRVPLQSVILWVSAMRIANETGGSLGEALERAADTVRAKLAMEGKIRALTAQGKLQAWIVGLLPVALFFVLIRLEPQMMSLLWTTRIGWGVLVAVAFLEAMGILLIRKIVAIDV